MAIGLGPHGVEGRLPFFPVSDETPRPRNTEVLITDPFLLYQNYISQGLLEKDELQLRVMKEFQKLYHRVVDYTPPEELSIKISLILRQIEIKHAQAIAQQNSGFSPLRINALHNLFRKDPNAEKMQLIKYITDEEELSNFASPQGLMIHGEVGCGKSMLMDMFAASLPHKSKMRWHYNNFILWVYSEMHQIQKERLFTANVGNGKNKQQMSMENEFILFEVAQKMINKNTVLMLDEFMLPDIAAANIIKILFTYYFKLGGVLVATSNKLPEELYSNEFSKTKFKGFVSILNARCQTIDMRSKKDYRSIFAERSSDPHLVVKEEDQNHETTWQRLVKKRALSLDEVKLHDNTVTIDRLELQPASFTVYNRTTHIPLTFNRQSVAYLDFSQICQGLYSSSDYITLASRFKTIIVDNVPVLTTKMKNEARRFITLLDAVYEAKCQFFMRSDVPVDGLFFPDAKNDGEVNRLEVQDEEMFAKTAIAMSNPYRPNVLSYDQKHTESYNDYKVFKAEHESVEEFKSKLDFSNTKAFTGEDEKFAYKRAVSRIKEMVNSEVWRRSQWVPIDQLMRPWEQVAGQVLGVKSSFAYNDELMDKYMEENSPRDIRAQLSNQLPRDYSQLLDIPFRLFNSRVAPLFTSLQHFWAMGSWRSDQGKRLKDEIAKRWIRARKA